MCSVCVCCQEYNGKSCSFVKSLKPPEMSLTTSYELNWNSYIREGVLSIFGRWGCDVFRVSFSPIFSRTGYQSKDVFLEQVVKKAHFL